VKSNSNSLVTAQMKNSNHMRYSVNTEHLPGRPVSVKPIEPEHVQAPALNFGELSPIDLAATPAQGVDDPIRL